MSEAHRQRQSLSVDADRGLWRHWASMSAKATAKEVGSFRQHPWILMMVVWRSIRACERQKGFRKQPNRSRLGVSVRGDVRALVLAIKVCRFSNR